MDGEGRRRSRMYGARALPNEIWAGGVAAALLALIFLGFAGLAAQWDGGAPSPPLLVLLGAASGMATVVFGAIYALWFRSQSGVPVLLPAAGITVLGLLVVGLGETGPYLSDAPLRVFEAVRGASVTSALALFAAAAVKRGWRPAATLGVGAFGALGVAIGMAELWIALWVGVLLLVGRASVRPEGEHMAWLAVPALGYTLAELGRAAVVGDPGIWLVAVPVLRSVAVTLTIAGLVDELGASYRRERAALVESEQRVDHLQRLAAEDRRAQEERDHEARSALAAIEFTARVMRRQSGAIDAASLEHLQRAIEAEIALLRRLLTLPQAPGLPTPFALETALSGVVAARVAQGIDVAVDIAPDLQVVGDPAIVAEIAQIVLDNAAEHAAGSAVTITAMRAGDWVVTQFDDAGPGIPADRVQTVFGRGTDAGHPSSAHGRGLGLFIASRLCDELEGHIWATASRAGGASLRLALPAAIHGKEGGDGRVPAAPAIEAEQPGGRAAMTGRE